MPTKPVSAITRINAQLKAQGREERLVRGRGYYYLHEGAASALPSSSIMMYRIEPEDYAVAADSVRELFAAGGIMVRFEGVGASAQALGKCQWFVKCDRDAVTTVKHPILGEVPCCQRCADFATKP